MKSAGDKRIEPDPLPTTDQQTLILDIVLAENAYSPVATLIEHMLKIENGRGAALDNNLCNSSKQNKLN